MNTTPPKPYPTFPLFAHARGYWCKKINGRQETFGRWIWPDEAGYRQSWREALERFNACMEARARADDLNQRPDRTTITTLVDCYLSAQEELVNTGKMTPMAFCQCREVCTGFRNAIGREVRVMDLDAQPALVQRWLVQLDARCGFHHFNKHVAYVSAMLTWAEHPITGVIPRPLAVKSLLVRKPEIARRREKRLREESIGKKRWTPDELQALLKHARDPLRVWMLLAYFAALGAGDLAELPQTAIQWAGASEHDLPAGWALLDWYRPKNEQTRAAMLPPIVADPLRQALRDRPRPASPEHRGRMFLTRTRGVPLVRMNVHTEDVGGVAIIRKVVRVDAVAGEFAKLRDSLARCSAHGWFSTPFTSGVKRPKPPTRCPACDARLTPMRKLGFYTFRHTSCTYAAGAVGRSACDLFEGRAIEGSRRNYLEGSELDDLRRIADRLVAKLTLAEHLQDIQASVTAPTFRGRTTP